MKLRTDVQYVTPDGRLTQAGWQALQGALDALAPAPPPTALVVADFDAAAIVTAAETIAANDVDTALPTAAAVKDYVDSVGRMLLATKTASASATLDFTEFDNSVYRRYEFECENVLPAADGSQFRLVVSTNGGASYDTGASDYSYTRTEQILASSESGAGIAGAPVVAMAGNVGNAAGERGVTGIIKVWSPGSAVRATFRWELHTFDAAAGGINLISGTGARLANQDTDAIRFMFNTGNITSGTIRMYGVI